MTKAKHKRLRKNKQKQRREFLESMTLEERKEFITSERSKKEELEKHIDLELSTSPRVYIDWDYSSTMIFKEQK